MDKDKVEYSPSGSDNKEYDNDEDELESGEFNSHCGDRCKSDICIMLLTPPPPQTQIIFTRVIANTNPLSFTRPKSN